VSQKIEARSNYYFCFLLGLVSPLYFAFLGRIYFVEILFFCVVIFRFTKANREIDRLGKSSTLFVGLALLSGFLTLISSFYGESSESNLLKGLAACVFLCFDFIGIHSIIGGNLRRLNVLIVGLAASSLTQYLFAPATYTLSSPWKFCFSQAVSIIVLLKITRIRNISIVSIGVLCLAAVNFLLSYRSAGAFLISALIIFVTAKSKSAKRLGPIILILLSFSTIGIVGTIYSQIANSGFFGESLQAKNLVQSQGRFGVLLGGRNEVAFSIPAVISKPLIGWGYSASPTDKIIDDGLNYLFNSGVESAYSKRMILQQGVIPSHSYLLQFGVAGGIFSMLIWIYCLKIYTRALFIIFRRYPDRESSLLYYFLIVSGMWAVIFSPFGAFERISVVVLFSLCSIIIEGEKS